MPLTSDRFSIAQDFSGKPAVLGTALTNADGTFIIRGLAPAFPNTNSYAISAEKPGFLFQHGANVNNHGGRVSFAVTVQAFSP